jgi:biopolymer transport protein ExbB
MLIRFIELGGPLMWPLLACSVLLGGVIVERGWTLGVRWFLLQQKVPQADLLAHRRVMPFFRDIPPSLGLLGTVVGVVQSFQLLNGRISAEAVGEGLGVACLTTVFGIGIAITASMIGYFVDWLVQADAPVAVVEA